MSLPFTDNVNILDGVSSTTTSDGFDVSKRQLKSIQFSTGAGATTSAVFVVDVTNDGTNWVRYNRLIDNLTGTSVTYTSTSSTFATTNTSKFYFFPEGDYVRKIRVTVTLAGPAPATATLQTAG